jgi:hypothetical protein
VGGGVRGGVTGPHAGIRWPPSLRRPPRRRARLAVNSKGGGRPGRARGRPLTNSTSLAVMESSRFYKVYVEASSV